MWNIGIVISTTIIGIVVVFLWMYYIDDIDKL